MNLGEGGWTCQNLPWVLSLSAVFASPQPSLVPQGHTGHRTGVRLSGSHPTPAFVLWSPLRHPCKFLLCSCSPSCNNGAAAGERSGHPHLSSLSAVWFPVLGEDGTCGLLCRVTSVMPLPWSLLSLLSPCGPPPHLGSCHRLLSGPQPLGTAVPQHALQKLSLFSPLVIFWARFLGMSYTLRWVSNFPER